MNNDIDTLDLEFSEVEQFPLDVKALVKGQTITASQLKEKGTITGVPGSNDWAFALLRLRDYVMARSVELGAPLSCRCVQNGLRIHTDSEALEYHPRRAGHAQSAIQRQVRNIVKLIDPVKLSSVEQQEHNRQLCIWGAKMAMLKKASRDIEGAKLITE